MNLVAVLFFVLCAGVLGGFLAKTLKLPLIVGYIVAGVVFGVFLPPGFKSISNLAEIGTILLLFSVGLELSFDRLTRFLKVAVFGSIIQIVLVSLITFAILKLFNLSAAASLILSLGFSLSSTAVVVKILGERGESDTVHGEIMLGWLLVQDLAVIPIMVVLPLLVNLSGGWLSAAALSLGKALIVVAATILLGKLVIPKLVHKILETNSQELLLLAVVGVALGTAGATSFFGISPALGAFLAGVVISESQEHHSIFAETRPLRDLFVAVFFVSLGFLVVPSAFLSNLAIIFALTAVVLVVKVLVVFWVSVIFGYKGKVAVANSFGLAQVGEFAFVIFSQALVLGIINPSETSVGISVTLFSLIVAPILFKWTVPVWRKLKLFAKPGSALSKIINVGEVNLSEAKEYSGHIIICGYGRVGGWVGHALSQFNIPFVVVDYNQNVVNNLKKSGISVLYGDPAEAEVMEAVGLRNAKAVVLAIPDRVAQEALIAYTQTVAPEVKIISRAHLDSDWEKLKGLKVDKIVQPEFEAAVEIVRSVLISRGKSKEEIRSAIKSLRVSHSR